MKKLIVAFVVVLFPGLVLASGGGHNEHIVHAPINLNDKVSQQKGAQIFMNNCIGCHSAKYMRHQRIAEDLGIPEDLMMENLVFTTDKIGETITSAIPRDLAKAWFGTIPPDLTLEARLRGADWLYSYLIGFHPDESRPWGVNNHVFKDVGMPHVLQNLQSELSAADFKEQMADLTNFMVYISEPARAKRENLGIWVIGFLLILLIPVYFMNKAFWKGIH